MGQELELLGLGEGFSAKVDKKLTWMNLFGL